MEMIASIGALSSWPTIASSSVLALSAASAARRVFRSAVSPSTKPWI